MATDRLQERNLVVTKDVLLLRLDIDHPNQPIAGDHRDRKHRYEPVLVQPLDPPEAVVLAGVADDQRLAVLRHPTGDAFAQTQPHAADSRLRQPVRGCQDKLRGRLVPEVQGADLGPRRGPRLVDHRRQQGIMVDRACGAREQPGQEFELVPASVGDGGRRHQLSGSSWAARTSKTLMDPSSRLSRSTTGTTSRPSAIALSMALLSGSSTEATAMPTILLSAVASTP